MKAIGIDIGTTTISTVVLDQESRQVLRSETISNGSFIKTENSRERIQDPAVILPKARNVPDPVSPSARCFPPAWDRASRYRYNRR